YKMVFVPFTGIDNHHRSVTLAAALLSNERAKSYGWLLRAFKKAFDREPMVAVTDQDPAMKISVEKEFNNSRHRLCMWHIMEKLSTKVGPVLCQNKAFKKRICDIVWTDTIEPSEFEREWHSIINDFELQSNNWFSDMFEPRFNWIPTYYRDQPMSGLRCTTSWSESKNHFFGFVVLLSFQRGMCRDVGQEMQLHEKNELDLMEETSLVMEIYVVKDKTGSVEYCIDKLASNIEELAIYSDSLQDLKSKVDTDLPNQRPMFDREVISSAFGVSKSSKVKIYNPLRSRNKGERSNKRIIPSKERAMTDGAKKGRKCKNCGDE
ncbi:FAR1-related sequence 5-like protein, partial [Tanacetum coccineum]